MNNFNDLLVLFLEKKKKLLFYYLKQHPLPRFQIDSIEIEIRVPK